MSSSGRSTTCSWSERRDTSREVRRRRESVGQRVLGDSMAEEAGVLYPPRRSRWELHMTERREKRTSGDTSSTQQPPVGVTKCGSGVGALTLNGNRRENGGDGGTQKHREKRRSQPLISIDGYRCQRRDAHHLHTIARCSRQCLQIRHTASRYPFSSLQLSALLLPVRNTSFY